MSNKIFIWVGVATALILLVPLIAMQFSADVVWGLFDFIIMGALLFGAGSMFVLAARRVRGTKRVIIGVVLFVIFLLIWAELAVGLFGTPFAGS